MAQRASAASRISMLETQNVDANVTVTASLISGRHAILRIASETTADLIVMGVTRSAGLRQRILGSTAIRVSHRSPIPVMILPAVHIKRTLSARRSGGLGWQHDQPINAQTQPVLRTGCT